MYIFDNNSRIKLHRLVKRKEDNSYIIGRKETEIYISTTKIGYEIICQIEDGKRVNGIKKEIRRKYGTYNVDKFINFLIMQGFIDRIDNKKISETTKKVKTLLKFINHKYVSWLFTKQMYFLYIIVFLSAVIILINNHDLFPLRQDYFLANTFIVLLPIVFIVSWILIGIHEFSHFIAAKSYKLPANFGISNRLFFLVSITDITNIYSLERNKRYRIILAGIFADLVIFSLSIILLYLNKLNIVSMMPLVYNILKFVVFSEFLGILWQFLFFMKTDIYYAFENYVRVYSLNDKAEHFLRNEFFRLFVRNFHSSYFDTKREKNVIYGYASLLFLGLVLLAFNFLYYYIPIALTLLTDAFKNILTGLTTGNYSMFYDAMVFVVFFLINFALLSYGTIRHYRLYLRPILYYLVLFTLITTSYLVLLGIILTISVLLDNRVQFYLITVGIALLFALFLIYLVWRIDKFDVEDFYPEE
ncbi:MAG: hypothetical protein AABW41_05530 [Nanoarchaeota archaeon]